MKQSQGKVHQNLVKKTRVIDRKPLVIYVSGAPGSGKTTLADRLAKEFYIPHVSSDLVHGGVRLTHGDPHDRKDALQNIFVPLLVTMAKMNISIVVDHVLQKGVSETDIIDKLQPHATIVYIHTQTTAPIERFYQRERARIDRGVVLSPEELEQRRIHHANNLTRTQEPLEIDATRIIVDTTEGYQPKLNEIVSFVEAAYEKEKRK